MPCGVVNPEAFLAVNFAWPLNSSTTPDEITASSSERVEDQMPVSLMATRFHRISCGDKISIVSSCRGSASWETRTHMGKLVPTSLVATRFLSCHRVGEVQVGKLAPTWENVHPRLLWRQDFYRVIVSGKCKLKTRTHMGKLPARFGDGSRRLKPASQPTGCEPARIASLLPAPATRPRSSHRSRRLRFGNGMSLRLSFGPGESDGKIVGLVA